MNGSLSPSANFLKLLDTEEDFNNYFAQTLNHQINISFILSICRHKPLGLHVCDICFDRVLSFNLFLGGLQYTLANT